MLTGTGIRFILAPIYGHIWFIILSFKLKLLVTDKDEI